MENLALTTLVLVILAFPGYIFRACYHSGKFTRHLLPARWTDDLVKAVLYSIPFHLIGLVLVEWLQYSTRIHHTLNFEIIFRLISGDFEATTNNPNSHLSTIITNLYSNKHYVMAYYSFVVALAFLSGNILRKLVWGLELDVKYGSLFRYRSEWLYELMGRGKLYVPNSNIILRLIGCPDCRSVSHKKTIVVLDALTDLATNVQGKTKLYSGIVSGFSVGENGDLQEIQLTKAREGKFKKIGRSSKYEFQFENIPGKNFIVKYSAVKNLNLAYLSFDAATETDETGSGEKQS